MPHAALRRRDVLRLLALGVPSSAILACGAEPVRLVIDTLADFGIVAAGGANASAETPDGDDTPQQQQPQPGGQPRQASSTWFGFW